MPSTQAPDAHPLFALQLSVWTEQDPFTQGRPFVQSVAPAHDVAHRFARASQR
jgi:hypothetical protein